MPELEIARELVELAEDDARALGVLLQSGELPTRIGGFHAQQAVEKALKAWMVLLDVDYPLTHSLYALLALLQAAGADCSSYEALAGLTPYAVELRYGMDSTSAGADPAAVAPAVSALVAHVRELVAVAEAAEQ